MLVEMAHPVTSVADLSNQIDGESEMQSSSSVAGTPCESLTVTAGSIRGKCWLTLFASPDTSSPTVSLTHLPSASHCWLLPPAALPAHWEMGNAIQVGIQPLGILACSRAAVLSPAACISGYNQQGIRSPNSTCRICSSSTQQRLCQKQAPID